MDARIRSCLLDVLYRYHHGIENSLVVGKAFSKYTRYTSKDRLSRLPTDLSHLTFQFLDSNSTSQLCKAALLFKESINYQTNAQLFEYNSYFLTEDQLVNNLLLEVLKEHFTSTRPVDDLQLVTLKFVFNKLTFTERIPKNIFFYILTFLHEFAFGVDATVPSSVLACFTDFVRLLRFVEMPRSFKYIYTALQGHPELNVKWLERLELFRQKFILTDSSRSIELVREFIGMPPFFVSLLEIYPKRFRSTRLLDVIMSLCDQGLISQILIDRLFTFISKNQLVGLDQLFKQKSSSHLARALKKRFGIEMEFYYFYTRNSREPFDMIEFEYSNLNLIDLFETICDLQTPSLTHMDAFAQLIRLGAVDSDSLSPLASHFRNPFLFEIFLKETPIPINLFFFSTNRKLRFTWADGIPSHLIEAFLDNLNSRDPFIFLTMNPKSLLHLCLIGKFDLNLQHNIAFEGHNSQVFSFLELLSVNLWHIFTSESNHPNPSLQNTDIIVQQAVLSINFPYFINDRMIKLAKRQEIVSEYFRLGVLGAILTFGVSVIFVDW